LGEEVRVGREVFEALVSETRIEILKRLDRRAMTVSELARELGLAKSVVHEHLAKLAEAGLVEKRSEGRKWVYYHPTRKARGILHPERRVRILLLLSSAILALLGGIFTGARYLGYGAGRAAEKAAIKAPAGAAPVREVMLSPAEVPAWGYLLASVLLIALSLLLFLLAYRKGWQKLL